MFLSISFGSGDGDGDGFGDGYGDGYGYGSGSGSGSGSGDGIKSINGMKVYIIDSVQTIISSVKNNIAKGFILQSDLTLTPCYIAKGEDLFAHGNTLKKAISALQEKMLNKMSIEQRIKKFKEHFDLKKKYSGIEFFSWHNILTGSCKTGRESFCRDHDIDLSKKYSVQEFVDLTKNAYGGDIVKQVI